MRIKTLVIGVLIVGSIVFGFDFQFAKAVSILYTDTIESTRSTVFGAYTCPSSKITIWSGNSGIGGKTNGQCYLSRSQEANIQFINYTTIRYQDAVAENVKLLKWNYVGQNIYVATYNTGNSSRFNGTIGFDYDVNSNRLTWSGARSGSVIGAGRGWTLASAANAPSWDNRGIQISATVCRSKRDYVVRFNQSVWANGEENDQAWMNVPASFVYNADTSEFSPTSRAPYCTAPTLSGSGCVIAKGGATCNARINWNIGSALEPNLYNATTSKIYSTDYSGTGVLFPITWGPNTIQARDGSAVLKSASVTGTCASGTTWNTTYGVCWDGSPYVPAYCGTNATSYDSTVTSYPSTNPTAFCAIGTSSPSTPTFPPVNESVSWICSNGGTPVPCSASRSSSVACDCSDSASHCKGTAYSGATPAGCTGTCTGTKSCSIGVWKEVAP